MWHDYYYITIRFNICEFCYLNTPCTLSLTFMSKISWMMFTLNMRHCIGICNLRWTVLHIDLGMSRDTFLQNLHNNYYVADILSCNGTCHWDCNFANIFLRKKYYLDHLASMASKASSFVRDLQKIFFSKGTWKETCFSTYNLTLKWLQGKTKSRNNVSSWLMSKDD